MVKSGVYMIRNIENHKVYIGSSKDVNRRWEQHQYDLNNKRHCNIHLQRSWNNCKDNFEFVTLELCPESIMVNRETSWSEYYNSTNRDYGYNIAYPNMQIITDEHRKNMSLSHIGKKQSLISRLRKSESLKKAYREGRKAKVHFKHTKEWKEVLSNKMKGNKYSLGRKHTEEEKKNLSKINKGKILSEEHKRKIGIANKGKIRSDELRKQWSLARMGKPLSETHRLNISNGIKQYFTERRNADERICN